MLKEFVERKITESSPDGTRNFFDTEAFPWVAQLEHEWRNIRAELEAVLVNHKYIPNFQDISPDQARLTQGEDWKTFFFYIYGHKNKENCRRCPETVRLLRSIPGMKTAMFSILAPKNTSQDTGDRSREFCATTLDSSSRSLRLFARSKWVLISSTGKRVRASSSMTVIGIWCGTTLPSSVWCCLSILSGRCLSHSRWSTA